MSKEPQSNRPQTKFEHEDALIITLLILYIVPAVIVSLLINKIGHISTRNTVIILFILYFAFIFLLFLYIHQ